MGALAPFRTTDKLEDALLDVMVSRLEVRGKHWFFQKVLREYLDTMDIDSAETVLDMGCGTGVAARTIARPSAKRRLLASSTCHTLTRAGKNLRPRLPNHRLVKLIGVEVLDKDAGG